MVCGRKTAAMKVSQHTGVDSRLIVFFLTGIDDCFSGFN